MKPRSKSIAAALCALALLVPASGCGSDLGLLTDLLGGSGGGALDLLSLAGGLFGTFAGGGDASGNADTADSVFFSVYNFSKETIRAEVTFIDSAAVARTLLLTTEDGASRIPGRARGTLTIPLDQLPTTPDAVIDITVSFPDTNDPDLQLNDLLRKWLCPDCRVRIGVLGTEEGESSWFIG